MVIRCITCSWHPELTTIWGKSQQTPWPRTRRCYHKCGMWDLEIDQIFNNKVAKEKVETGYKENVDESISSGFLLHNWCSRRALRPYQYGTKNSTSAKTESCS